MKETVEKYFDLINKDIADYQEKGEITPVHTLCKIIAFFYIRNNIGNRIAIVSDDDLYRILETQARYLKSLSDVYTLNGLDALFEDTLGEITFLNEYTKHLPARFEEFSKKH